MDTLKSVTFKVSANSDPHRVAGAISHWIRENYKPEDYNLSVRAVGFAAVARATYAIALATKYMALENHDIVCKIVSVPAHEEQLTMHVFELIVTPIYESHIDFAFHKLETASILKAVDAARQVLDEQNIPTEGRRIRFEHNGQVYEMDLEEFNQRFVQISD